MMHSNLNSFLILMVIMSSTLHTSAIEVRKSERALSNKNLLVAADAWPPFFIVYCSNGKEKGWSEKCPGGNMSYGGITWELLLIVQRTRNISFTILESIDRTWGNCHGKDNCTGMVGMVNRGEADLALGEKLVVAERNLR